jgi:hypothetical protein
MTQEYPPLNLLIDVFTVVRKHIAEHPEDTAIGDDVIQSAALNLRLRIIQETCKALFEATKDLPENALETIVFLGVETVDAGSTNYKHFQNRLEAFIGLVDASKRKVSQ